ncbi:MAG: efflux RND transporter permease subunit, partial [Lachnospiraceae bacterium]|nr:efflux RND transporter permease subunit [Lachnospiraceae bacterium]
KAEKKLEDATKELEEKEDDLTDQQKDKSDEMAKYTKLMNQAVATLAAYESNLQSLKAYKTTLKTEMKAYKDNKVLENYSKINSSFQTAKDALKEGSDGYNALYAMVEAKVKVAVLQAAYDQTGQTVKITEDNYSDYLNLLPAEAQATIKATVAAQTETAVKAQVETLMENIPDDVKDAIDNPKKLKVLQDLLKQQGQKDAAKQLTVKNLEQLYNIVEVRIPQIESELSNLKMQILTAKGARDAVKTQISKATDNYEQVESGKITAAVAFGSGSAQLSSAKTTLESSKKEIKVAKKSYEQSRKEALKNANLDKLLTIETLSQLMQAENFSMPAGYINDDKTQYLLKIDEKDESDEDIAETMLTHIDKVGDIRLKDVAEITVIDNSDEIYAKVNDENAIVLSVYKSSSAGTATVANKVTEKFEKLKKSDSKLHITSLMNQGDYIGFIIDSVLSNLLWGALFAIVVLFFFLKDIKPTIVVAFSIPLSVLFAILAMYATNITMNMISLSGLALGIGMLVDNSIVVIENIYRLRNKGISAARAAVMGANQVAGAIFASTLTTICVFLPIVFTDGLTKQLILDMSLTISYSLLASLLVALTVVPCMGATLLKNTKEKKHRFFDALINGYEKVLRLCLKFKIVPILIAVGLLAFCVVKAVNTGIVVFPEMGSNQMSVSVETNPELENKEAFEMLDDISDEIKEIKGVETVGATQNSSLGLAGMGGDSANAYSIMILLDEKYASKNKEIAKDIEKILETKDLDDYEVSESNMDMSAMMGSGLSVNVYGEDEEELLKISDDLMKMISKVNGFEEISNGQEDADQQVILDINKDKAMKKNLTVAQIFMALTDALKTDGDATSVTVDGDKLNVSIKDERDELTLDNLLDYKLEYTKTKKDGTQKTKKIKLKELATYTIEDSVASISHDNGSKLMTVSAMPKEGYNTTLLTRKFKEKLEKYDAPDGYDIEIAGEEESVNEMLKNMGLMLLVAVILIYLIMVAQFANFFSPLIIMFTIPLAFTGGFLALFFTGSEISILSLMGFLILSGVVVNNGIVFVDYVNKLRLEGVSKIEALVETGKTRMRPILMTALTTILGMSVMAVSRKQGSEMGQGMAVVTIGGLLYATLMTLFIVPVLYDIFYRKETLKKVDLGDESTLNAEEGEEENIEK